MKNIFYCYLISLLLLSSPSKASHAFGEEITERINRGLSMYESLSRTWIDTREDITKGGLVPFIDRLTDAFKPTACFMNEQGITESFIAATIKKTAPDIQMTLSDMRNDNLQHYNRPCIFSSLNILETNAFFYTLGSDYQNVDSFIIELLHTHLTKSPQYAIFCDWCNKINPAVKTFFCSYVTSPYPQPAKNAQAYHLLWREPYQILPQAINTRLEELFASVYSPAELRPISSISTHRDNAATPQ